MHTKKEIWQALDNEEFFLCYQPIVALSDRTIVGAEALIRWQHPKLGVLFPDGWIPLAERDKRLIYEIEAWVVGAAIAAQQRNSWKAVISVNVSPSTVLSGAFCQTVRELLESPAGPQIKLELTERVAVHHGEQARSQLPSEVFWAIAKNFSEKSRITLVLDDFGTGYNNLNRLKELPVDEIKLDRVFTRLATPKGIAIVGAMINLATELGIDCTAEGVETELQAIALKKMGCGFAQGYRFCSPLPEAKFNLLPRQLL